MAALPPTSDLPLIQFCENVDTRITAQPTVHGVTAAIATEFHGILLDTKTRIEAANNPDTRSKVTITNRNVAKKSLRAKAQQIIRIITACPTVTPGMRAQLNLNPIDTEPTPILAPVTAPQVQVDPHGNLLLSDSQTPNRFARPKGTKGAVVLAKIAPASEPAPTGEQQMQFAMLATRGRTALAIDSADDTKKLYVAALWFNERGQLGPMSEIVSTTIAA